MTLHRSCNRYRGRMDRAEDLSARVFLIIHCRVDASKPQDRIPGMSIGEYDAVRARNPGEITATLDELIGSLAH